MEARSEVLGHWAEQISTDWEQTRSWAQRIFSRERIGSVVLLGSTVAILVAILFSLYRAVQSNTIVGGSPYLSSLNLQLSIPGY